MHHVRGHCLFCSGDVQMVFWTTTITPELYSRHELSVRVFFFPLLVLFAVSSVESAGNWRNQLAVGLTEYDSTDTPQYPHPRAPVSPYNRSPTHNRWVAAASLTKSPLWAMDARGSESLADACLLQFKSFVLCAAEPPDKKNYFTLYFSACVRRRFNLVLRSCDLKDSKPCNHEVRLFLSSCLSSPLFLSVLTHD